MNEEKFYTEKAARARAEELKKNDKVTYVKIEWLGRCDYHRVLWMERP